MDDDGWVLMAQILYVTGGKDGESLGVNIEIAVYMPAPPHPLPKRRTAHHTAKIKTPPLT